MRLPPFLRFALVTCLPVVGVAACWVHAAANQPEPSIEWTLESASLAGDVRQVRHFLDTGKDLNAATGRAATPLAFAAFGGRCAVAKLLMSHGASPRGRTDPSGRGPIHWSVIGDQAEMVDLLLAHGADVNAPNNRGETPLHLAVELGAQASADVLIAAGADLRARDARGVTPLDVALATPAQRQQNADGARPNPLGWAIGFAGGAW